MTFYRPSDYSAEQRYASPSYGALTLRLFDPTQDLLTRHIRLLRDCVALAQKQLAFDISAAVVLPAEVRLLCLFDRYDSDAGRAVHVICETFQNHVPVERTAPDDPPLWSDDVECVHIPAAATMMRRRFMENAPVRAGLVKSAVEWPYSSIHRHDVTRAQSSPAVA